MNILTDIKALIQKLINKAKGIENVADQIEHQLEQYIPQAIHISSVVAGFLANPIVDGALTLAIGANAEAAIENVAKEAVKDLTVAEAILALPTAQQQLIALAQWIKDNNTQDGQQALLAKIAALILKYLDGNKQKQNIYDLAIQGAYSESVAIAA